MGKLLHRTVTSLNTSSRLMACLCLSAFIAGCGGGDSQAPDPVVLDLPIAYVKRPLPLDMNNNPPTPIQPRVTEALTFNEGGDLWVRDRASPSAAATNITMGETNELGDVKDVESSYDGKILVFSLRKPDLTNGVNPPTWNIYVYNLETKVLKPVIPDPIIAEEGEDIAPHFLSDGRIVFTSTRQQTSKVILTDEGAVNNNNKQGYTSLDESRNEHALSLHVMNTNCLDFDTCEINDSSDINQISFNQSHDLDPVVLSTGEILFTRWDHMGSRNAMHLYKTNPDGTEMKLVYGRQSHDTGTNGGTIQFLQPREMPDGRILSILKPFTGTYGGGEVVAIDVNDFADDTRLIQPNTSTVTGTAQTSLIGTNVTTTPGVPSPGGRFSAAYPLWDGTNRMLVSWTPCRVLENNILVTCTPARLADPAVVEGPPLYGLYVYDLDQNTQLPIFTPEENVVYTDIVVAAPRTPPTTIYDKIPGLSPELSKPAADEAAGILHIRSVYDLDGVFNSLGMDATALTTLNGLVTSDPDGLATLYGFNTDNLDIAYLADPSRFTSDERPARFLRIVKGVGIPDELNGMDFDIDNDAFGQSTQQGMREILGYAPIEPDGSVMVKVPANVPLALSVLDKFGRRITVRHQSWIQVKPGETVTCSGCHAPTPNTVNPVDGIHGHATEPVGSNAGAPENGYQYPGTTASIFGDTISGQPVGQTMAQARWGDKCTLADCKPTFDVQFEDIWTVGTETPFSYEYRNLNIDEPLPLSTTCYDPGITTNLWQADCRTIINYEEVIQPIWESARSEDITCDGSQIVNDPRCSAGDLAGAPVVITVDSTCTSCHAPPNQRLLLTQDPRSNANHYLSYTELFTGTTISEQFRDPNDGCRLQTTTTTIPDPTDPTMTIDVTVPDVRTVTIPPQMSVAGSLQSVFFDRFTTDATCQTVDHKAMLSDDEKKMLYEWLDVGAQYFNDPTNANVPVN